MTVRELFDYVLTVRPHVFSENAQLIWLNELEGRVQLDIFLLAPGEIVGYGTEDMEASLLVDSPHSAIYRYWMEAMVQLENGEYNKYQNTMELFNTAWTEFSCWFAETQGTEGDGVKRGFYLSAYGIAVKHGYTGSEEEWLEGLRGPEGPRGPAGPQGPAGADGNVAFDKLTAAQIEMLRGPQGLVGPVGPQGERGETGPQGPQGPRGIPGESGPQGPSGPEGPRGYQGSQGPQGPRGPQGDQGVTGPQGPQGEKGATGQAGHTPVKGEDYFTEADKAEMVELVLDALPETGGGGDGRPGADGITPRIGANGNWWIGETDTGVAAQGPAGKDGSAGKDGTSATHSWNGTTLTITSVSGTSSANLKGDTGATGPAGRTPVKGEDYFTDADKQELVASVLAALPAAEEARF